MKKVSVAVLITVLTAPCPALASSLVDCFYSPRPTVHQPSPEWGRHPKCLAVADNGSVRVLAKHLKALDYSFDGLAVVWIDGGMLYVKPSGETLDVLPQDNGADPFEEGLVRGRRNGKIAFFDHSFRMVLPAKYDFAWPFEDGLAEVCSGCVQAPPDPADPEHHTAMEGGAWGFIDHQGREVVPVSYPRDEAWRRKGDAAKP